MAFSGSCVLSQTQKTDHVISWFIGQQAKHQTTEASSGITEHCYMLCVCVCVYVSTELYLSRGTELLDSCPEISGAFSAIVMLSVLMSASSPSNSQPWPSEHLVSDDTEVAEFDVGPSVVMEYHRQ